MLFQTAEVQVHFCDQSDYSLTVRRVLVDAAEQNISKLELLGMSEVLVSKLIAVSPLYWELQISDDQ